LLVSTDSFLAIEFIHVMSGARAMDEQEIRALIDRCAKAVRDENRAAIRADHDADILMFDVPLQSQGLDATLYGSGAVLKSHRDGTMLGSSMRRVGLIDITVGNATRLGASQRSTKRRCASQPIATQRLSRWGSPAAPARLRSWMAAKIRHSPAFEQERAISTSLPSLLSGARAGGAGNRPSARSGIASYRAPRCRMA
jgi:hypothetical protein